MLKQISIPPPRFLGRGLNRLYHQRVLPTSYNHRGIDIVTEDWDNLLILDGCRYDLFREHATEKLPGELEARESRGSNTVEFLQANFHNEELHDMVYITANPQLYRHRNEINVSFHLIENIWSSKGWNDKHDTVLPETVTDVSRQITSKKPNKRLLVHYVQPHYPFIGAGFDSGGLSKEATDNVQFWHKFMLREHNISKKDVWDAYVNNLKQALPAIQDLMDTLQGKTVVTADHGNMIGESSSPIPTVEWGHPPGIYTEELVRVPWLVYENGTRKNITSEPPEVTSNQKKDADDIIEDRLRQLGYKK